MAGQYRIFEINDSDTKTFSGILKFNNSLLLEGKSLVDNTADDEKYREELEGRVELKFRGATDFNFCLPISLNVCPKGSAKGSFTLQIEDITYTLSVNQYIHTIKQKKNSTCWLCAATMMKNWKDGKNSSNEDTLNFLGKDYWDVYNNNLHLTKIGAVSLAQKLGLNLLAQAPKNSRELRELIERFGPLFAIYPHNLHAYNNYIYHSIIIVGINDTGKNEDSKLIILDPWVGEIAEGIFLSVKDFLNLFGLPPSAHTQSYLFHFTGHQNLKSIYNASGKGNFLLEGTGLLDITVAGANLPNFQNDSCYSLSFEIKVFDKQATIEVEKYGTFEGTCIISED